MTGYEPHRSSPILQAGDHYEPANDVEVMNEPHASGGATAEAGSDESGTFRLVIRARIIAEDAPRIDEPRSHRRLLTLAAVGFAGLVAVSWIGIRVFGVDAPPASTANETPRNTASPPREPTSTANVEPPQPATTATAASSGSANTSSTTAQPAHPPAATDPDTSASAIHEVLPAVSRNALQTIRGTVRVAIRVDIDRQGSVVAATAHEPGPSRYFERHSLEAAKQWKFAPANTDAPRTMLLRFDFTRERASARATRVE